MAATSLAADDTTEPSDLRIMSFNVRYSRGGLDEQRTENNWTDPTHPRRDRAIRVIRQYQPDILGVQEARELQVVDLREALPEYDVYAVGRDDGKSGGEHTPIFYRKQRFERPAAGTFWLSTTPEEPGTSFHTAPNAVPRIASWVRLRDQLSGGELLVLNTHWDHISVPARRKSANLIRQRLATLANGLPTVVMGDLNTPEDSAPYRTLLGEAATSGRPLVDSFRALHRQRSPEESTFNHWRGTVAGSRIDFILHTKELVPIDAEIVRTSYDGRWPSDHYPVTATLRLQNAAQ